jgi:phenylalanyl-tRNA synthetase beta chain
MPTITLDKKTVLKMIGKSISDSELRDRIPMMGTDLDEVSKKEIHVEIFPNRPDMLSEQGFGRALSSFLGKNTGLKKYTSKKSNYKMIIDESVENVRPYTACAVVKNLKFDDEKIKQVIQIQEKLHVTFGRNRKKAAIGIYPMEHIKFPITFKALLPNEIKFQPLESNREMTGSQILSQHSAGREYGHLLEELNYYPVFFDANNKVLSMPPIINSHDTGRITEKTKEVFIECSGFDKNTLSKCLNMIVCALSDMGGDIYSMEVNNKHEKTKYTLPDLEPEEMKYDLKTINNILGLKLKDSNVKSLLGKMGMGWEKNKALVPCYRSDIISQFDLIEDISIAYGFENFEPTIPKVSTIAEEAPIEKFKNKIRDMLVGLKMFETKTYNITSSESQSKKMNVDVPLVKLANSLTVDFDVLRYWMTPSLMDVLKQNKRYDYPQNYFDFGRIFKETGQGETGITENDRLCVILCGKDSDFTKIKQVLDLIFNGLGQKYSLKSTKHDSFIPGRVGRVSFKKKEIAYVGEIHPEVLGNFEVEMPVAVLELNVTELFDLVKDEL